MSAASTRLLKEQPVTRDRVVAVPVAAPVLAPAGALHRVEGGLLGVASAEVRAGEPGLETRLRAPRRDSAMKRLFDIVISASALIVLSPLMALIWLAVASERGGSALFMSPRVGRHGRIFMMPKFRSMVIGAPTCARETFADCHAHITPIGKVLRRAGLDELPQLVSVLRGDMSLIGPRPLLVDDPAARERTKFPTALEVRPGISGLAQVSGRNLVSARRKARLDAFYARTDSLGFDFVLLLRTIVVVVSGKGFV